MPSRIVVEVAGNESSLQAATAKAADALKALSDVVARTAKAAIASGDEIRKSNQSLADSFTLAAGEARKSSSTVDASVTYQTDAVAAAAKKQIASNEDIAASMRAVATQAQRSADAAVAASTRASGASKDSAAKTGAAFGVAGSGITKFGKLVTEASVAAAAGSLYAAAKFQQATTQFTTQAGVSVAQTNKLKQGILGMAAAVGQTPDELAGGMYHIVSSLNNLIPAAGRAKTELGILKVAAEGAAVGNSNMTQTTYVLSALMNALGQKTVPQAKQSMAELNAIVGAGDMHMQDLVNAMSTGIVPVAKTFGVSLQSMGGALDVLADKGVPAQQAATKLRMALTEMGAPTKQAAAILEGLGLSSTQAISSIGSVSAMLAKAGVSTTQVASDLRKPDGILVALEDLRGRLEANGLSATGAAATISRAFGGIRGATVIETLYQSLNKLQGKYVQIGQVTSQFGTDYSKTQQTLTFQAKQLEGGVEALAVEFGDVLIPPVESVIHDLEDLGGWFDKNKTAAHDLGIVVAGVLSVAVASFATSKAKQFIGATGDMLHSAQNLASWLTGGLVPAYGKAGAASDGAAAKATADSQATATAVATEETEIAGSTAGIDASFAGVGTAATESAATVETQTGLMSADVTAARDTIVADNAAVGLSFRAMLGPIALAAAAIEGYNAIVPNFGAQATKAGSGFGAAASTAGGALTAAQLKNLTADIGGGTVTNTGRRYPWSDDLTSLTSSATSALRGFATTGDTKSLQNVIAKVQAFDKSWSGTAGNAAGSLIISTLQKALGDASARQNAQTSGAATGKSIFGGLSSAIAPAAFQTPQTFAKVLLAQLGVKATPNAIAGITDWAAAEGPFGTQAKWNPLNISEGAGATGSFDGTPAQNFSSAGTGLAALVTFLKTRTPGIVQALGAGASPAQLEAAINATNWTGGKPYSGTWGMTGTIGTGGVGGGAGAVTPAASPSVSQRFNPFTGAYQLMTSAQYQTLLRQWNAAHPGMKIPSSPSSAVTPLETQSRAAVFPGGPGSTMPQIFSTTAGGSTVGMQQALSGTVSLASLVAASKKETTTGTGILGGLKDAIGSKSLSSLNTVLNASHVKALQQFVKDAKDSTVKGMSELVKEVVAAHKKALAEQTQLQAYATVTAANTAFGALSSNQNQLYTAGVNLGINTPDQALAAQQAPISGITGSALSAVLPSIIGQLEQGMGTSQYTSAAALFGGKSSELGTDFGALASGTLNAADSDTLLTTIDGLVAGLADNTTAVLDNTAQQMVSLLQQQNTTLAERAALSEGQGAVLRGFIPNLPKFASGGPILQDGPIYAHAREHVVPEGGALVLRGNSGPQNLNVHFNGDLGGLMSLIDSRVSHPENVLKISRQMGRRTGQLSGAPGGFRR